MKSIKNVKLDYVIQSAIMIVIGLVLAVWTKASIDIIARALAVLLVLIGAIFIVGYFTKPERDFKQTGGFVAGIIIAAIGAWIFWNPGAFTDFIPKLFGIFILISGLRNLGQTISLIRYKAATWPISLIVAIVTCGLGSYLLFNPTSAKEFAVTLIGVFLIIDGATNLLTSVLVGVATKRAEQEKNAIDAEAVVVEEVKK